MKDFEDLTTWQKAIELAKEVYEITKSFPSDERFGVTSQIRRAVVSISSNVAEGFGRKQPRDKEHFYVMALGSLLETKSLIYLSRELGYTNHQATNTLLATVTENHKLLNALIASQRKN